jgi:hypothetical protein
MGMDRREFLQLSCVGGVGLGAAPAWAAPTMALPSKLRVDYAVDGSWVDASLLPNDDAAFAASDAEVTVLGMAAPALEELRSASIEIGYTPGARRR